MFASTDEERPASRCRRKTKKWRQMTFATKEENKKLERKIKCLKTRVQTAHVPVPMDNVLKRNTSPLWNVNRKRMINISGTTRNDEASTNEDKTRARLDSNTTKKNNLVIRLLRGTCLTKIPLVKVRGEAFGNGSWKSGKRKISFSKKQRW